MKAALFAVIAMSGAGHTPEIDGADLTLSTPAKHADYIVDGAYWTCRDTQCHSASVPDRPLVYQCMHIVEQTGAVTALTYRGQALSADDLAKCNSRARS